MINFAVRVLLMIPPERAIATNEEAQHWARWLAMYCDCKQDDWRMLGHVQ